MPIRFILMCVVASFASVLACGPMNTPPKASGNQAQGTLGPSGFVKQTKNNLFLVYAAPLTPPTLGDNPFVVRVVCGDNLHNLSNTATIHLTYWMPSMPEMGKFEASGQRQDDGTYSAILFFSMAGSWSVTVQVKDSEKQDEGEFEIPVK